MWLKTAKQQGSEQRHDRTNAEGRPEAAKYRAGWAAIPEVALAQQQDIAWTGRRRYACGILPVRARAVGLEVVASLGEHRQADGKEEHGKLKPCSSVNL